MPKYPDDFEIVWHGGMTREGSGTKGELLGNIATTTPAHKMDTVGVAPQLVSTSPTRHVTISGEMSALERQLINRLIREKELCGRKI